MISQAIGVVGGALIVLCYYMVVSQRWPATSNRFLITNGTAALLLVISLCFNFNLGSMMIEWFWIAISISGLYKNWRLQ